MTIEDKLPYVPDLDRLMSTYLNAVDSNPTDCIDCDTPYGRMYDPRRNPYFNFLSDNGFIRVIDNRAVAAGDYNLGKADGRREFARYLRNRADARSVFSFIGDDGKSLHAIISHFGNTDPNRDGRDDACDTINISENDIRVIVAWLEHLNQIRLEDGKYIYVDDTEDDEEGDTGSIYPINYNKTLDITEEKYSIFEYLRKIKSGKILKAPKFQRNLVWSLTQKSRFIESVLLGIPIPPFYVKRNLDGGMAVIDGLQRTAALEEFKNNEFKLEELLALPTLNGYDFSDLQEADGSLTTKFEDKQLNFYVLGPSVPMSIVYDIFNRINTGGTKLERQEIRNCVFIGPATELLKRVVNNGIFKEAVDGGISDKRMKAREAILRCMAFAILPVESYDGSIDEFLERALKKINLMDRTEIDELEMKTLNVFKLTFKIFGKNNFRIPSDNSRGKINVAVMESVFNCFWGADDSILNRKQWLTERYNELVRDRSYLNAFRISTSIKSGVSSRFRIARQFLNPQFNIPPNDQQNLNREFQDIQG